MEKCDLPRTEKYILQKNLFYHLLLALELLCVTKKMSRNHKTEA